MIDLFGLKDGRGGSFKCNPRSGSPFIEIGLDSDSWRHVVAWLTHEAMEYCLIRMELCWEPWGEISNDSGNRRFQMDHSQFGDVVARTAYFLTDVLPELATVYNKLHPSQNNQ